MLHSGRERRFSLRRRYFCRLYYEAWLSRYLRLVCDLQKKGIKSIFDFADDPIPPGHDPQLLLDLMERVNLVTVSSIALQQKYVPLTSTPIQHVYDLVDTALAPPTLAKTPVVTIGWMGHRGNLPTLFPLADILNELASRHPIKLVIITSKELATDFEGSRSTTDLINKKFNLDWEFREWQLESVNDLIKDLDIGLIPVKKEGAKKSANRVFHCALSGIIPLATYTDDNSDAIGTLCPELLCKTKSDWQLNLKDLVKGENKESSYQTN